MTTATEVLAYPHVADQLARLVAKLGLDTFEDVAMRVFDEICARSLAFPLGSPPSQSSGINEDGTPFQIRRLFVTRLAHQFSRKLRARILGQVANDRRGQEFNVNSVIGYDFTARSAFLVGYNFQRRSPLTPRDLAHEFFVKFSYLFHF